MQTPAVPKNENERLKALKEYSILDTLPEKEYEDISYLASQICQTPISLISLIDDKRQWFKSHLGLETTETPRKIAFCAHAINNQNDIMIIPDSRLDVRFHDNPLVTGNPHIIFYAGVPLVNPGGFALGTICVVDDKPKELNETQIKALQALANQVMRLFEFRRNRYELELLNYELKSQNHALTRFADLTAHDLRSPLGHIRMVTDLLESKYSNGLEPKVKEFISDIKGSSTELLSLIDGILQHSKNTHLITAKKEEVNVSESIQKVFKLVDTNNDVIFTLPKEKTKLFVNRTALERILINLITNAIKYNDKEEIRVSIRVTESEDSVRFSIEDNGPGIQAEDKERIFQIFETTSRPDRDGRTGTGIGLATVKTLVEGLGGSINLETEVGKGSNFEFTIKKN